MRNGDHIQQVLDSIESAWHKHPEYRLGQLLVNAAGISDIFYMEDKVIQFHLRAFNDKDDKGDSYAQKNRNTSFIR